MMRDEVIRSLSSQDFRQLRRELSGAVPLADALSRCVGEAQVGGGIWRLFSARYPNGGVSEWNSTAAWKPEWELTPAQFHAFGEDLFGNQLILRPYFENALLWNHEDGSVADLLFDPATLLETIVQSGLDWIDFYNDGSLKVAEARIKDVPPECHLHWTTPLILGGKVTVENTSVVERSIHLVGHGKLWRQLREANV
jgi:hypothetical protein